MLCDRPRRSSGVYDHSMAKLRREDDENGDDVAMFVDWENLKFSLAQRERRPSVTALREAAEQYGRVVYARAYADWEDNAHAGDPRKLYVAGLEPVYVLTKRSRDGSGDIRIKNSVDVKMAADCIEASHQFPNVGTYIIVSGDNDFVHIVNTLRPRGKRVVLIGVSWTTASHLTEQADVVLYYDLDIEPFGEHAAARDRTARTEPIQKLEPAVAAATDQAVETSGKQDSETDRRKIAEAIALALQITREYREAGQQFTVSLLGQELQKRMNSADFQRVGKGRALAYARALEKVGKLKIVTHDFVDHLYLPGEPTEMAAQPAAETEHRPSYDYAGYIYQDLNVDQREAVVRALSDELNKPGSDWLTFKRMMQAVGKVVERDEPSLKNLVNSLVSVGLVRRDQTRTGRDPESGQQYTYTTFTLDYQHPDVRRTLNLG